MTVASAHVDTFAAGLLPPREQRPDMIFSLPELQYPDRMNCAARLLDRHVFAGNADRRCALGSGVAWSYGEMLRTANRIANVLVDDLGIVPGNRVLLRAPNSPMLATCWFAVLKAGAIAVTSMPLLRAGELRFMIEKAEVRHALCDARLADDLRIASGAVEGFRTVCFGSGEPESLEGHMASKPEAFDNVDTAAEDVAAIAFTSGTTGRPKAAVQTHRDFLASCDSYGAHVLRPSRDDLFCGTPPLAFTYGLGGLLLFPMHAGAATLLLEKATPELLLQAIEEYRVSVLFTAPVAYRAMAESVGAYDVGSLHTCVSAGETLPPSVWRAWYEKTGVKILDGIGSTEMFHIFVGSPVERAIPGSTGLVVPGYRAEIHDDAGNPLPPNTVGRLAVKGPTGCRYLDDERQTTYVRSGWNYPGDAYRMDEEGRFWYVARIDDMIISSGYNISGPEVEAALMEHPDVSECAVVAKPDRLRLTNVVKAYVVLADGIAADEAKASALGEFVRSRIAPFKCPREIEFVASLPRTETGKVQRFRLRQKAASEAE